jgi:hypothetical protein
MAKYNRKGELKFELLQTLDNRSRLFLTDINVKTKSTTKQWRVSFHPYSTIFPTESSSSSTEIYHDKFPYLQCTQLPRVLYLR